MLLERGRGEHEFQDGGGEGEKRDACIALLTRHICKTNYHAIRHDHPPPPPTFTPEATVTF